MPFAVGFAAMTFALHMTAVAGGVLAMRSGRPQLVRFAGASIAVAFALLLVTA